MRRYFFAKCKEQLGRVRGKFGGALKTPDSDLTLEYDTLLAEAKEEYALLVEELSARLTRLSPKDMTERKSMEASSLNASLFSFSFSSALLFLYLLYNFVRS